MTSKPQLIQLIIGLGNPGREYEHTYHNVGTMFLEYLEHQTQKKAAMKHRPLFSYTRVGGRILAHPKTFMNESGFAAHYAMKFFKIKAASLLVVHDESDIPLGTFRIQFGRGPAGHRGVASIIEHLGTTDFFRLRIGTRTRPGKAGVFVLRAIDRKQKEILYGVFDKAIKKLTENVTP